MNPIPVVIDNVLLALETYSVPVLLLLPSCETGELLQTSNFRCDDIPIHYNRCSSPGTRGGLLCFAAALHLLAGLENGKLTPFEYSLRLA